ncbi:hypothetical protein Daudx_1674 [Candidatus Desulforudis audaxviator]|nr:hypothetical protein Daudx_1674 [Candidatus Desulforudis audaxviator]
MAEEGAFAKRPHLYPVERGGRGVGRGQGGADGGQVQVPARTGGLVVSGALPPELQREAEDFIRFLLEKRAKKTGKRLRQDWAGALKDFREQYTSLELQKKALEWRGD